MSGRALLITLAVSAGGHALFFVAGSHMPTEAPAKRLIDIAVVQKPKPPALPPTPPPKPPKPLEQAKKPLARTSQAKPAPPRIAPPRIFGVDKSNTVGDMAVQEGNSLMADPQAIPSPEPTAPPPREEEQTFLPTGEADFAPVPKSKIQAIYPEFAKIGHIEGKVILELDVDANGKVVEIRVLKSAHPSLSEAAIAAIRGTRFTPAIKDDERVAVTMRYPFTFSLSEPTTEGTEK